jgi:predicted SAM-dependent methyltransferase
MTLKQTIGRRLMYSVFTSWRTISVMRFEWTAMRTRVLNVFSPSIRRARHKISRQVGLNVNLGSGGTGKEGWVNIDISRHHNDVTFPYDIRKGLPFQPGQVARVFAEHVIEHIEFKEDLPRLLKSIWRTLEPGGRLRIVVPDCRIFIDAYVSGDLRNWRKLGLDPLPHDMPTHMAMLNNVFHQGGEHMFGYDFETMKYVLEQAGFSRILKMACGLSDDPILCLDRPEHATYSLYVEAVKEASAGEFDSSPAEGR